MADLEKGYIKKKYNDIGTEEVDGKTVEDKYEDAEHERCTKESE